MFYQEYTGDYPTTRTSDKIYPRQLHRKASRRVTAATFGLRRENMVLGRRGKYPKTHIGGYNKDWNLGTIKPQRAKHHCQRARVQQVGTENQGRSVQWLK